MYQGGRRKRSHDYLRSCDYCGRLVLRSSMVKKDNYLACKDDARGRERVTLDKANAANVTPRTWKPARSRLSDRDNEIDVYQADEAVAFNAIAVDGCVGADGVFRQGWAPYELVDTSGPGEGQPIVAPGALSETPRCAGWSIDYLYKVLTENRRPASWLANATRKITELANWLLAHQFGGSATATVYGGLPRDGQSGSTATIYAEDQGIALLGLLRAYQATGTITFLLGARAAATCLRRMQCGGLRTSSYLVSNAGGGIFLPGPFSTSITGTSPFTTTTSHSTDFYAGDLVAIEALSLLKSIDGDSVYGDSTAVGEFSAPTAATLSSMISQAQLWWRGGAPDASGANVVGFSATSPWEFYRVSTSSAPTAPDWKYKWTVPDGGYLTSLNIAKGLRGLYAVEGMSTQVRSVYAWLRGISSPSSFLLPAGPGVLADRTTLGTFDASIAPPAEIFFSNGVAAAGAFYCIPAGAGQDAYGNWNPGPAYDLAAAGILADVQAAAGSPGFKNSKDKMARLVTRNWLRRELSTV